MKYDECHACRFWWELAPNADFGQCRRRAPVAPAQRVAGDLMEFDPIVCYAVWPVTFDEYGCGEFELRPDLKDGE